MITAPERWPSETILIGIFLSVRSITSGASMYAAGMRPAISDSFTSGQPLYLLYSNCVALPSDARATQATGNVRLQVTARPPTISGPRAAPANCGMPEEAAAAAAPRRSERRLWKVGGVIVGS